MISRNTGVGSGERTDIEMLLYSVLPINWEYNDETYRSEGYGVPRIAYRSKERAWAKALELEKLDVPFTLEVLEAAAHEDNITYQSTLSEEVFVENLKEMGLDPDLAEKAPDYDHGREVISVLTTTYHDLSGNLEKQDYFAALFVSTFDRVRNYTVEPVEVPDVEE
jgi:hypothetical protein